MRITLSNYRSTRVCRCPPVALTFLLDPWSSFSPHHFTSVPDAPHEFLLSAVPTSSLRLNDRQVNFNLFPWKPQ